MVKNLSSMCQIVEVLQPLYWEDWTLYLASKSSTWQVTSPQDHEATHICTEARAVINQQFVNSSVETRWSLTHFGSHGDDPVAPSRIPLTLPTYSVSWLGCNGRHQDVKRYVLLALQQVDCQNWERKSEAGLALFCEARTFACKLPWLWGSMQPWSNVQTTIGHLHLPDAWWSCKAGRIECIYARGNH
jgi:hypothetical protein